MQEPDLKELLDDPREVREFGQHLDRCIMYMVLYLKYEPEHLERVVSIYDNLTLLRNALQNHKK